VRRTLGVPSDVGAPRDRRSRFAAVAVVVLAATAAVAMIRASATIRSFEAPLVQGILGWWYAPERFARFGTVIIERPPFGQPARGVDIGAECSVTYLWVPQVIAFALVSLKVGRRVGRYLVVLAATAALMLAINTLRITTIMWSSISWGATGEWISHNLVGTAVAVATIAGVLCLQMFLSMRPWGASEREMGA
jgi:exosortase/archaeosortase family protein